MRERLTGRGLMEQLKFAFQAFNDSDGRLRSRARGGGTCTAVASTDRRSPSPATLMLPVRSSWPKD